MKKEKEKENRKRRRTAHGRMIHGSFECVERAARNSSQQKGMKSVPNVRKHRHAQAHFSSLSLHHHSAFYFSVYVSFDGITMTRISICFSFQRSNDGSQISGELSGGTWKSCALFVCCERVCVDWLRVCRASDEHVNMFLLLGI